MMMTNNEGENADMGNKKIQGNGEKRVIGYG